MPIRRSIKLGMLALGAAAALAAGAAQPAQTDAATYDLSIAGMRLGSVQVSGRQEGARYSAAGRVTPNAVVGAVTGYAFDGRASGTVAGDGRLIPDRFVADSSSPRAKRRTEIEWRDGAPVRVSVEPPRRRPADPSQVVGALDPVSAGFAILRDNPPERICNARFDVFDGSRRSRLSLGEAQARDGGYVCAGVYARVEGESHSLSNQDEYPFTLTFAPNGDGTVRLVRIETQTRLGLAVVTRRG